MEVLLLVLVAVSSVQGSLVYTSGEPSEHLQQQPESFHQHRSENSEVPQVYTIPDVYSSDERQEYEYVPDFVQQHRTQNSEVIQSNKVYHMRDVQYSQSQENVNYPSFLQLAVSGNFEKPADEVQFVDTPEIDATIEQLCENETRKILLVWKVIAKHLGITNNDYVITDTTSVKRLSTIIQTFITLSKKKDFNHMSIRGILEVIQEHLKNKREELDVIGGEDSESVELPTEKPGLSIADLIAAEKERMRLITELNEKYENEKDSDNSNEFIIRLPEVEFPSKHESERIISEESSKHITHVVIPSESKDNDEAVVNVPEYTTKDDRAVTGAPYEYITPPIIISPSEKPDYFDIEVPVVPSEKIPSNTDDTTVEINDKSNKFLIIEEEMYPRPIKIDLRPEYVESHQSMSIWQQILRVYGNCIESRVILMKIKVLLDALDRLNCVLV